MADTVEILEADSAWVSHYTCEKRGSDHRSVGPFHGLRPLLLRLPGISGVGVGLLGESTGDCQTPLSLFQGLEAKKRSSHFSGGLDRASRGQRRTSGSISPAVPGEMGDPCCGQSPGLRSLNDSFWLLKFNFFFFWNDTCFKILNLPSASYSLLWGQDEEPHLPDHAQHLLL